MFDMANTQTIQAAVSKGWKPNAYLTNMSIAYFQNQSDYVATRMFPMIAALHQQLLYFQPRGSRTRQCGSQTRPWKSPADGHQF